MIKSSVWQQDTKVAKVQVSNHRASEYSKEDLMGGKRAHSHSQHPLQRCLEVTEAKEQQKINSRNTPRKRPEYLEMSKHISE